MIQLECHIPVRNPQTTPLSINFSKVRRWSWAACQPSALLAALSGLLLLGPGASRGEELKTESRTPFVHHLPLRDVEGKLITLPAPFDEEGKPQDSRGLPFSTAETCGKCHEYAAIGRGWHFNAASGLAKPGRPGEPWMLTDPATYTQIPVSYRGWAGTFKPAEIGLNDFDFITTFGRHFPGGGVGEPKEIDPKNPVMGRMLITGKMEVDCLLCHESSGHYNHETRFKAINAQNIKWAPTLGAGLGTVAGFRTAKTIAASWRPGRPATTNVPAIKYDRGRFDADNNVLFQVSRRPSPGACYYCHTTESQIGDARWHSDGDVHIRAGMNCTDCHRNGVDHMVVRGYEGELKERSVTPDMIELRVKILRRDNTALSDEDAQKLADRQLQDELGLVGTLSCRGCHFGTAEGSHPVASLGGRLGAPRPIHKGLPPIHLEKLSCTACHSGPFPSDQARAVHTSLAHKLGLPAPARGEKTAPVIVQPVFLRGYDGRIAPHKMVWPSYWGRLNNGKVTPLLPEEVSKTGKFPAQTRDDQTRDPYITKPLDDAQIQANLEALGSDKSKGEAIWIAAGKMYRLDGGKLKSEEHASAKPYAWALGHDVRPASQAVGARGCADCHATDSPIYFGTALARGPVNMTNGITKAMWEFRGDDRVIASTFATTFVFRPLLKYISFGSALIVLGVLLHFGLLGVGAVAAKARGKQTPSNK